MTANFVITLRLALLYVMRCVLLTGRIWGGDKLERSITRIVVAAATRRRPRMFADLLQSLQGLDVPQGAELCFVFVENDTQLTITDAVNDFYKRTGWPAFAVHEPQQGISHARNAAMDAARDHGADWLAFVDDDEQVRHDWLRILWAGAKDANAQLAGGPVVPVASVMGCSDAEADVLAYYERAATLSSARKTAAMAAGKRFDLATNNWIAQMSALDSAGLRFDPAFGLSGGEDTDVSRRAVKKGLTLAWVPSAIVTEEVPPERLSASYISERARAQSITKYHLMLVEKPGRVKITALAKVISRGISGAIRVAFWPVLGRYSYFRGIRSLGISQGFWAGLRGQGQASYTQVTGE
ncbi:glycosyltransferase [Planktotalea sp.]|uniref:glycosyltransferase n=1 Tax=Planktotalea sp. TaxID=2029877 RepID=UPI003D6AB826